MAKANAERVELAVKAYTAKKYRSVRQSADAHDASETTVRERLKGRQS